MNDQIDPAGLGLGAPQDRPRPAPLDQTFLDGLRATYATPKTSGTTMRVCGLVQQLLDEIERQRAELAAPYVPARGDAVEAWLEAELNVADDTCIPELRTIARLLSSYRAHADAGLPSGPDDFLPEDYL